jgi:hypothetical protein
MAKLKRIKKWGSRARLHAERAEAAADRAEVALHRIIDLTSHVAPGSAAGDVAERDPSDAARWSPAYTSPRGEDATPPAADVP